METSMPTEHRTPNPRLLMPDGYHNANANPMLSSYVIYTDGTASPTRGAPGATKTFQIVTDHHPSSAGRDIL